MINNIYCTDPCVRCYHVHVRICGMFGGPPQVKKLGPKHGSSNAWSVSLADAVRGATIPVKQPSGGSTLNLGFLYLPTLATWHLKMFCVHECSNPSIQSQKLIKHAWLTLRPFGGWIFWTWLRGRRKWWYHQCFPAQYFSDTFKFYSKKKILGWRSWSWRGGPTTVLWPWRQGTTVLINKSPPHPSLQVTPRSLLSRRLTGMPTKVTLVWSAGQRGAMPRVSMVLLLLFLLWSPLHPEDTFLRNRNCFDVWYVPLFW